MKKMVLQVCTVLFMLLVSCAGGPVAAQSSESGGAFPSTADNPSRPASGRALQDMDAAFAGNNGAAVPAVPAPAARSTPAAQPAPVYTPQPVQATSGGARPGWVDNPYAALSRNDFFAAAGYGTTRALAEQGALAALTALFGQNIRSELRSVSSYAESVSNGSTSFSENTAFENFIRTTTQLDTLLGSDIRAVWDDGRGTVYALAVMEKALARPLYADLIRANERLIAELINLSANDRNSFDGYARYRFAGVIADVNQLYGRVLTMVGAGDGIDPAAMKKGDDYRLDAATIARSIPVTVRVTQDPANQTRASGDRISRIQAAFNAALTGAQFRTGRNGRYLLEVSVSLDRADFPNNPNIFCRYALSANLTDTADDSVLYSFNVNANREGHTSYPEAENRAVRAMENKINADYAQGLTEYLSTLLPQ
jgi:hypothetical protein